MLSDKFAKCIGVTKNADFNDFDYDGFEVHKIEGISGAKDARLSLAQEPGSNGFGMGNSVESLLILKEDHSLWGCYYYNDELSEEYMDVDSIYEKWGKIDSVGHIMDNVTSIESVGTVNAVLKHDNSLWAWGDNTNGRSNLVPEEDRVRTGGFGTEDVREIGYDTMESAEPVKGPGRESLIPRTFIPY